MRTGTTKWAAGFLAGCAALTLASLGFAAPATAATYKGLTSQDAKMKLTTNVDGEPTKAKYGWDMRCKGGGSLSGGGTVSSRFTRSNPRAFSSGGEYTGEIERRFEAIFRVKIKGERDGETRFTGSFRVKAQVFDEKSGELVARCTTGVIRWTADLAGPAPLPPTTPRPALKLP